MPVSGLSVVVAPVTAGMSGVMGSIVLVQSSLGAICLNTGSIRRTFTVMRVSIVVVMAGITHAGMLMHSFNRATRYRVLCNTADTGKRGRRVVSRMTKSSITTRQCRERKSEDRCYRPSPMFFHCFLPPNDAMNAHRLNNSRRRVRVRPRPGVRIHCRGVPRRRHCRNHWTKGHSPCRPRLFWTA